MMTQRENVIVYYVMLLNLIDVIIVVYVINVFSIWIIIVPGLITVLVFTIESISFS